MLVAFFVGAAPGTTTAALSFSYDVPAIARVDVQPFGYAEASPSQASGSREWSASPSVEARGASTTPAPGGVATEGAGAAERTVVMGRNMPGRVIPYAEKNGYDFFGGSPRWIPRGLQRVVPETLEKVDLWFNKRWVTNEMSGGSRIIDIGQPPGMPPSNYYNMEVQQVDGYWNYFQDFQP